MNEIVKKEKQLAEKIAATYRPISSTVINKLAMLFAYNNAIAKPLDEKEVLIAEWLQSLQSREGDSPKRIHKTQWMRNHISKFMAETPKEIRTEIYREISDISQDIRNHWKDTNPNLYNLHNENRS